MSGSVSDTVTFVWQNGDIISQTSTSHKADYTYTYDLSKPCQAGDIQYSNYRLSIGLKRPLNAHLCTAITDSKGTTLVNYNYDNTGRIVGYTATVGGNTIGAATYDYVP
jgi:hypothetical protein